MKIVRKRTHGCDIERGYLNILSLVDDEHDTSQSSDRVIGDDRRLLLQELERMDRALKGSAE